MAVRIRTFCAYARWRAGPASPVRSSLAVDVVRHPRIEHVSFRDDRSVVRSVTIEFHVPEEAPVFRGDDGQHYSFVPLSVMRRKTLVNFEIRDHEDRPVAVPSLRQNQAITESLLLACADAVAEGHSDKSAESRREIEDFVHRVVSGAQQELVEAYDSLESGREPEVVRRLAGNRTFKAILDRMADNFILWVMIPTDGPRRRVLKFSCDEPLYLHYRQPGHKNGNSKSDDEVHTYGLGKKLGPWRLTVLRAALGLTPTRIRFPVPTAENAKRDREPGDPRDMRVPRPERLPRHSYSESRFGP